jgi:hypothetical protein
MRIVLCLVLAVFAAVVLGGSAAASTERSAAVLRHGPPALLVTHSSSLNWAGYASYNHTFSDVKGTWTQPTADCSATNRSTYSSFWVGLDGYNSNSVEQIGTDADCSHGRASYYAWYEMYPAPSVSIANFPITPGTAYTAEVKYTGSDSFTLTLTGGGHSFSTTQTLRNAPRSSAEWIAEAPSLCAGGCHITPLTDFGRVDFTGASADAAAIDSWGYDALTMVTNGGQAKAQPSALSNNGTAFSVSWSHF